MAWGVRAGRSAAFVVRPARDLLACDDDGWYDPAVYEQAY